MGFIVDIPAAAQVPAGPKPDKELTRTRQPPSSISIIPALARCARGEDGSCGPHAIAGVEVI